MTSYAESPVFFFGAILYTYFVMDMTKGNYVFFFKKNGGRREMLRPMIISLHCPPAL